VAGGIEIERTYPTFTLVSVVISVLLIFFGAFLLGLMCGWMWWGRRDDDLALLGSLGADARLPNRAKRISALCHALDVPTLPTDPAGQSPLLTIDGVAEPPS
jgi:hypothetical protein